MKNGNLKRFLLILIVKICLLAGHTMVAAEDKFSAVNSLNALLEPMGTMSAKFEQLIIDGKGAEIQRVTGSIQLQRPGQFLWLSDEPYAQKIVSNGEQVWIYDMDLEQVTIRQLDKQASNTPALLLSGNPNEIATNFAIIMSQKPQNKQYFELSPKSKGGLFEKLSLTFQQERLANMILLDSLGNTTTITFSAVVNNLKIAAADFEFQIPDGVDVISDVP